MGWPLLERGDGSQRNVPETSLVASSWARQTRAKGSDPAKYEKQCLKSIEEITAVSVWNLR
jgi:hypothetical protein